MHLLLAFLCHILCVFCVPCLACRQGTEAACRVLLVDRELRLGLLHVQVGLVDVEADNAFVVFWMLWRSFIQIRTFLCTAFAFFAFHLQHVTLAVASLVCACTCLYSHRYYSVCSSFCKF